MVSEKEGSSIKQSSAPKPLKPRKKSILQEKKPEPALEPHSNPPMPWELLGLDEKKYREHREIAEYLIGGVIDKLNEELYKHLRRVEIAFETYDSRKEVIKGEKCLICDLPGYEVCPLCLEARASYKEKHLRLKL